MHPQTQPEPPRRRRAPNYQELKKIPVKFSLNRRATSGKAQTQQPRPSEAVHGAPGREGQGWGWPGQGDREVTTSPAPVPEAWGSARMAPAPTPHLPSHGSGKRSRPRGPADSGKSAVSPRGKRSRPPVCRVTGAGADLPPAARRDPATEDAGAWPRSPPKLHPRRSPLGTRGLAPASPRC